MVDSSSSLRISDCIGAAMSASDQKRGLETIGRWYWRYFGIGRSDKRRSMQRGTNLAGQVIYTGSADHLFSSQKSRDFC
jgi:hypothetical protein